VSRALPETRQLALPFLAVVSLDPWGFALIAGFRRERRPSPRGVSAFIARHLFSLLGSVTLPTNCRLGFTLVVFFLLY
jgi:hypothetical protein